MNNSELGKLAEQIALQYERATVSRDTISLVRSVSDSPTIGYDIERLDTVSTGHNLKAIEVKTWNQSGYFIISSNEVQKLKSLGDSSWIYIVDIKTEKVVKMINNPFKSKVELQPISFKYFY